MKKFVYFIPLLAVAVVGIFIYKEQNAVTWAKEPVVMYNGFIFDCDDPRGTAELPGDIVHTVQIQSVTDNEWPAEHLQSNGFTVGEEFCFVSDWPNLMYWYSSRTGKYYSYKMNYADTVTIPSPGTEKMVTLTPMLMYNGDIYIADGVESNLYVNPAENENGIIIQVTEQIPPLEIPQKDLQSNFCSERTALYFADGDSSIYLPAGFAGSGYIKMIKQ